MVTNVEIIEAQGRKSFRFIALEAIEDWRFSPAMVDGVPQPFTGERTVFFDWDGSRMGRL